RSGLGDFFSPSASTAPSSRGTGNAGMGAAIPAMALPGGQGLVVHSPVPWNASPDVHAIIFGMDMLPAPARLDANVLERTTPEPVRAGLGGLRPHSDLAATGNQMPSANGAAWPYPFADKPVPLVETSASTDKAAPSAVGRNVRFSASALSASAMDDSLIEAVLLRGTNQGNSLLLDFENDAPLDANPGEPPAMLLENPPPEEPPHGAAAVAAFLTAGLWQ